MPITDRISLDLGNVVTSQAANYILQLNVTGHIVSSILKHWSDVITISYIVESHPVSRNMLRFADDNMLISG